MPRPSLHRVADQLTRTVTGRIERTTVGSAQCQSRTVGKLDESGVTLQVVRGIRRSTQRTEHLRISALVAGGEETRCCSLATICQRSTFNTQRPRRLRRMRIERLSNPPL